ncbi:hypothetical protein CONCODRAFT_10713 [Conidiobolus coronatus NRRL 28638]|uniref:MAPEG-domain-containing protein n=1 Tax=Conidiobolus coronatus (strain ATCC 28846 / CBS 209.66 / NRRL 28638) TaxID=796925 RepID=A0A137NX59_CONC2|nr:hypothetical protein CONCODRAFT_10713 [Conidiobolus coronatus NRRL 28638]|eukprot:KXN67271.1 hypothetical protein CONCODRAFT_10713 [Conidiobolus coronatus NRRL 28638]
MYSSGHLSLQFSCMFIIYLIWLALIIPVRYAQTKQEEGLDNNNPRLQYSNLSPLAKRCYSAHNNTLESFVFFSFALVANVIGGGSLIAGDVLSVLFLICRIGYSIAFIMDYPKLRTFIWFLGTLTNFVLFLMPFATTGGQGGFMLNYRNRH